MQRFWFQVIAILEAHIKAQSHFKLNPNEMPMGSWMAERGIFQIGGSISLLTL